MGKDKEKRKAYYHHCRILVLRKRDRVSIHPNCKSDWPSLAELSVMKRGDYALVGDYYAVLYFRKYIWSNGWTTKIVTGSDKGDVTVKRRNFLGFVGAVMAAPKKMAQAVTPSSIKDLALPAAGQSGFLNMANAPPVASAQEQLVHLLGKSAERKQEEARNFYVQGLDPDTAGLRSLSIGAKIRMTKRIQYEQCQKNQELTLRGVINGIFG